MPWEKMTVKEWKGKDGRIGACIWLPGRFIWIVMAINEDGIDIQRHTEHRSLKNNEVIELRSLKPGA